MDKKRERGNKPMKRERLIESIDWLEETKLPSIRERAEEKNC